MQRVAQFLCPIVLISQTLLADWADPIYIDNDKTGPRDRLYVKPEVTNSIYLTAFREHDL